MKIQLLFFGMAKDLSGRSNMSIELEKDSNVTMFREFLIERFPSFSAMDSFAIAVNESYAEEELLLSEGDIIAIIPPVSGG